MARFLCDKLRGSPSGQHHDTIWEQINFFTLTFKDRNLEAGFAKARQSNVLYANRVMGVVLMVPVLAVMLSNIPELTGGTQEQINIMKHTLFYKAGMFVTFSSWAAICHVLLRCKPAPITTELTGTLLACLVIALHIGAVPFFQARMLGYNPYHIWDHHSPDTDKLLIIDAGVTAMHLFNPIRSCTLLLFQVCSVLCYVVPAVVYQTPFAEQGSLWWYSLMLVVLVYMAAIGKRQIERQERAQFLALIQERTLRVQTEFKLSRLEQATESGPREASSSAPGVRVRQTSSTCSSALSSAPSTSMSDTAFVQGGTEEEVFESITDIGMREQWLVDPRELQTIGDSPLGRGAFGVVTKGLYHGALVAVKAPRSDGPDPVKRNKLTELCNELRIMRRLRHPNIVFMYGATLEATGSGIKLCLVMELVAGWPLGEFVVSEQTSGARTQAALLGLLVHIASALRYLHTRRPRVIHGDLKDSNIFVEGTIGSGHRAKLLDFGLSRRLTAHAPALGGSLRWAAPELFHAKTVPSCSADVFSFGRVAYLVATGKKPFEGMDQKAALRHIQRGSLPPWPPVLESRLSSDCQALVQQCCHPTAKRRPKMPQVLQTLVAIVQTFMGSGSQGSTACTAASEDACSQLLQLICGLEASSLTRFSGPLSTVPESSAMSESSEAQPAAQQAEQPAALVHRSLQPTTHQAMKDSLALVVLRWNHAVPRGSCCWVHSGVHLLRQLAEELAALPCDEPVPPRGQCSDCGLLRLQGDGGHCTLCGRVFEGEVRDDEGGEACAAPATSDELVELANKDLELPGNRPATCCV